MSGYAEHGVRVGRTHLLKSVETFVGVARVRAYGITYETSSSGASLLQTLTECADDDAGNETCKPPTTFTYSATGGMSGPQFGTAFPIALDQAAGHTPGALTVMDWNGDGRDDLLTMIPNGKVNLFGDETKPSYEFVVLVAGFDGAGSFQFDLVDTGQRMQDTSGPNLLDHVMHPISDFDNDGRDDVILAGVWNGTLDHPPVPLHARHSIPNAAQAFEDYDTALQDNFEGSVGFIGDVNGDGRDDIFFLPVDNDHQVPGTEAFLLQTPAPPPPIGLVTPPIAFEQISTLPGFAGEGCATAFTGLDFFGNGRPSPMFLDSCNTGRWFLYTVFPSASIWMDIGSGAQPNSVSNTGNLALTPYPSRMKSIDLNADGALDILELASPGTPDPSTMLRAIMNRRGITMVPRSPVKPNDPVTTWDDTSYPKVAVIDVDGDGRQDLVFPQPSTDDPARWEIIRNAPPDSGWLDSRLVFQGFFHFIQTGGNSTVVGDFNGDGRQDLAAADLNGQVQVSLGTGAKGDLLSTIQDGLNNVITIDYEQTSTQISDVDFSPESGPTYKSLFQKTPGATCDAPARCLRRLSPLVSSHSVTEGGPELTRTFNYRYEDARESKLGQGWLGFAHRSIEEVDASGSFVQRTEVDYDNKTYDDVNQVFPFAGRPTHVRRTVRGGNSGDLVPSFASTQRVVDTDNLWTEALSDVTLPFPHLTGTTTTVSEGTTVTTPLYQIFESDPDVPQRVDQYGNQRARFKGWASNSGGQSTLVYATTTFTDIDLAQSRIDEWQISLPTQVTTISARNGDSKTQTTSFTYDADGRLATITQEPNDPDRKVFTQILRTPFGNVNSIGSVDTKNNGRTFGMRYDDRDLFPVELEFRNRTGVLFDSKTGLLLGRADNNGIIEQWAYDGFGRVRRHIAPGIDATVDYEGVAQGTTAQMAVATTVTGHGIELVELDSVGRTVNVTETGFQGASVRREFEYDSRGHLVQESRPHLAGDSTQGIITHEHDGWGRPIRTSYPDGSMTLLAYASAVTLDPSLSGLLHGVDSISIAEATDRNGHVTRTVTDMLGNPVTTQDQLQHQTQYSYGAFNQLATVTDSTGMNVTTIVHDQLGRVTELDDPDMGQQLFTYTGFGEVLTHKDANRNTRTFHYDVIGRVDTITDIDGTTQFEYDGSGPNEIGRLVSVQSPSGHNTVYSYEPPGTTENRGFLSRITHVFGTGPSDTHEVDFSYDALGRLDTLTYPSAGGQTFAVRQTYDDPSGALKSVSRVSGSTSADQYWQLFQADQGYRLGSEQFGNGLVSSRIYDHNTGRISGIATLDAQNTIVQNLAYTYDFVGNMQTRIDLQATRTNETFGHDEMDRLRSRTLSAAGGDPEILQLFTYDNIGNVRSNGGIGTYDYAGPKPHAVTTAGNNTFTYDSNGNMTGRSGPDIPESPQTFTYTAFNLPKTITSSAGTTAFDYDGTEQRISKSDATGTTQYVPEFYERRTFSDAPDTVEHVYRIYGGGREIAQLHRFEVNGVVDPASDKLSYLLSDSLGSTNVIADSTGTRVGQVQRFAPFGNPEPSQSGSTGVNTGFTGHQHDTNLGLVNMRGRIYDPIVGRFTTPDPAMQAPYWSQGLNRYSYAWNNPHRWVDPSGFDDESADDLANQDVEPCAGGGCVSATDAQRGPIVFPDDWIFGPPHPPPPTGNEGNAGESNTGDIAPSAASTQNGAASSSMEISLRYTGPTFATNSTQNGTAQSGVAQQFLAPAPSNLVARPEFTVTDTSEMWKTAGIVVNAMIPVGEVGVPLELGARAISGLERSGPGLLGVAEAAEGVNLTAGSIRGVNVLGGTQNCVACSIAADATLGGSRASAVSGGPFSAADVLAHYPGSSFIPANGYAGIKTMMSNWGPGARGIVWGTRGAEQGHMFNVVNQGGIIRFLDAQSGGAAAVEEFEGLYLLRTQ